MKEDFSADIAAVQRIAAVRTILEDVCSMTGMGFAAVARVTEARWIACHVLDRIEFGMDPGDELEIKTTICDEIRASGQGVFIDDVAADPEWRRHHTPTLYGFRSYISIPIVLANGDFFGTLCAIDPAPSKVSLASLVPKMQAHAALIARELDAQTEASR